MKNKTLLTTASGIPVADNRNSRSAGARGPLMLDDFHLVGKLAHFNREVIPEWRVHAKGSGAYGTFRVTQDIRRLTTASPFEHIGKETPVLLRFSTVGGERGSADTERHPRGFALKFYTEQGNWDVVGNNTSVFFIRDPLKFPDFIHTQKRDPATNLKSPPPDDVGLLVFVAEVIASGHHFVLRSQYSRWLPFYARFRQAYL